ncbi:hypothetical protein FACS189494_11810 [Spirochaetia bacterium]|nr:hypothetical protein FACS189494_11810 [Spirochaetia bacterium]
MNMQESQNNSLWQDKLYKKTFQDEWTGLERRRAADVNFTANDLNSLLKTLYDMDGADWLGRGEVQSIILSATIAAHEVFLQALKKK